MAFLAEISFGAKSVDKFWKKTADFGKYKESKSQPDKIYWIVANSLQDKELNRFYHIRH
jgi:hypothetical protein